MACQKNNKENNINQHPHRRYNILTGEWVLVSPHRNKRPWQGKTNKKVIDNKLSYDTSCYLCPKNTRASGDKNPDYKNPYSFINDFSALLPDVKHEVFEEGSLRAETEAGICKVVCFSPNHALTLPLMTVEEITQVVKLWKKEYLELGKHPLINHVQIFENKGDIMGCSNPHPHGQIWSQFSIPEETRKKQLRQKEYWETHKKSLLGAYLEQELELDKRVILKNNHFVALIPFWAVWPYETMIIPIKHYQHIGQLNEEEEIAFADIIKRLTTRYDNLFETSFPYSSGIHQSPTDGESHSEWHFHMSFYPPLLRSAEVKKFMVSYEMFGSPQRDITPEQAGDRLRELIETVV